MMQKNSRLLSEAYRTFVQAPDLGDDVGRPELSHKGTPAAMGLLLWFSFCYVFRFGHPA